jgi:hypothetical protein
MKDKNLRKALGYREREVWCNGKNIIEKQVDIVESVRAYRTEIVSLRNTVETNSNKINFLLDILGYEYQTVCRERLPKLNKKEKK